MRASGCNSQRATRPARRRLLFAAPLHPYTRSLLHAIPTPDPDHRDEAPVLEGEVASPLDPPPGCRFHPRCPLRIDRCRQEAPLLLEHAPGHWAACFRAGE